MIAHDVYSETNPAFCACALVAFTRAFITVNVSGPELPTVYLSLPVALSGDLGGSFAGTSRNTGSARVARTKPGGSDRTRRASERIVGHKSLSQSVSDVSREPLGSTKMPGFFRVIGSGRRVPSPR